ncbi:hypothetical protein BKK79_02175 [Cupriavidus sp. USMAA2-4]|nr:hypothetical protein BKK79_02175 [Cupriavidus sp. USMAA2-4]
MNPAVFVAAQDGALLGLPAVQVPTDNPTTREKIDLGKKVFFDKRLSADGTVSCASCHQPDLAFSDGMARSRGIGGRLGTRNAPTLLNAALMTTLFWDGRRTSLEEQVLDPFVNPAEQGLTDLAQLLSVIKADDAYQELFDSTFGTRSPSVTARNVANALATYVRSLARGNSPFDRFYFAGDQTALAPPAQRGFKLFMGRAQCVTCHEVGATAATFTDQKFHSLHIGMDQIEGRLPELSMRAVAAKSGNPRPDATVLSEEDISELGRFFITLNPAEIGQFRTPSLRNVALTAPYMHDGSVGSLQQAVEQEVYYRSAQTMRPIILTPDEKMDLIEFLKSLSGS